MTLGMFPTLTLTLTLTHLPIPRQFGIFLHEVPSECQIAREAQHLLVDLLHCVLHHSALVRHIHRDRLVGLFIGWLVGWLVG